MNHLRRMVSFLLVLVLCFGLIPGVSAAEVDTPGADIPTEVTAETAPPTTEDTTPTEESVPEEPPVEEAPPEESVPDAENTEPSTEDVPQDGPGIMEAMPNGTSTWSIGSTQKSIMLFDYADNGDYTTRLNSQVACAYKPNGSGTTRTAYIKNLGWHFARYGGVAYADDPLYEILEDSLNLRDVQVYDTIEDADGHKKQVLNAKETTLAAQKQQLIRDAFKDWIWADPQRRQALVRQYNEEMNSTRPREYDGSHIVFAGMNPEITLREHQRNAIAHVL